MSVKSQVSGWFKTKTKSQFLLLGVNAFLIGVSVFSLFRIIQRWNYNVLEKIYLNTAQIYQEVEKFKEDYQQKIELIQEEKFNILAALNSLSTASYNTNFTRTTVAKWIEANLIDDLSKNKNLLLQTSEFMLKELKTSQEWFKRAIWFFQKHQNLLLKGEEKQLDKDTLLLFKLSTTLDETVALLSNFLLKLKQVN